MLNWMKSVQTKVTDFNVGSIVRSMLESCAIEIDEFYKQAFIGLKEAIPVSVYTSFNFPALAATPASGLIRVTITVQVATVTIASGTVFVPNSGSINFASTSAVNILAGATTADVPVAAQTAGIASNIPSGVTFIPSPVPTGFVSATNLNSFINGIDTESDADHKTRFNAYISTLARGTPAAIAYGLTTAVITDSGGNVIERVVTSQVVEPWKTDPTQPVSLVNAYIHNGVGGTSGALVIQAQAVIDGFYDVSGNPVPGWKAAGVKVVVAAAAETPLNITGVLTAFPGFDEPTLIGLAIPVLNAYLVRLPIATTALYAQLITLVESIPGVYNFVLSAPTTDIAGVTGQKIMPGAITIT
jgi:hypothetical protein